MNTNLCQCSLFLTSKFASLQFFPSSAESSPLSFPLVFLSIHIFASHILFICLLLFVNDPANLTASVLCTPLWTMLLTHFLFVCFFLPVLFVYCSQKYFNIIILFITIFANYFIFINFRSFGSETCQFKFNKKLWNYWAVTVSWHGNYATYFLNIHY